MSLLAPRTTFERIAARYIRHRRALGLRFDTQAWVVDRLARYLDGAKAADLDAGQFEAWCTSQRHLSANARRAAQLIVRKLCLYRRRTEADCYVPDPLRFARRGPYRAPVLFGPLEVARMLKVVSQLPPHPQYPLRRAVLRIAIVLLYTAGLRRGELLALRLCDIDCRAGTLRIRESKFHKSRLVPLSDDAQRELRVYLRARLAPPWDISPPAPLLGHQRAVPRFRAYVGTSIGNGLRHVFDAADIRDAHGRQPHVHDFRHSFAVQALLRWYRAGANVQAQLPKLAMYMGHVSIASTAYYLHFLPEIAVAASERFERAFGHLIEGAQS